MTESGWQRVADDLYCIALDQPASAQALAATLRNTQAWCDVVCGGDTVTVQFDLMRSSADAALKQLNAVETESALAAQTAELIEIPACYDTSVAPDLVDTCQMLGLGVDAFIELHSRSTHEVAMLGFMPGFAYVDGLDPSLQVDRLDQPRQHVAAGSIGIAGKQTGLYPFDGPGGWRLVARTPLRLFDAGKNPPALLQPLQKVRFVPITLDEFEASL